VVQGSSKYHNFKTKLPHLLTVRDIWKRRHWS